MFLILQNVVLVKGQQKAPISKCTNGAHSVCYVQRLFWGVLQHDNSKWTHFMSTYENESRVRPNTCEKLLWNTLKPDLVACAISYSADSTHAQYITIIISHFLLVKQILMLKHFLSQSFFINHLCFTIPSDKECKWFLQHLFTVMNNYI